jgi:hypothetical protein
MIFAPANFVKVFRFSILLRLNALNSSRLRRQTGDLQHGCFALSAI